MVIRKDSPLARAEKSLLERVDEALADAEVRRALACSLLAHNAAGRRRLYERIGTDSDTVETLRGILDPSRDVRTAGGVVVGKTKVKQQWDALWREWEACVEEASCEEGKYVQQDHHWEPPYFCAGSLSTDLDGIAKRMRAILPRVQKEQIDSELSFFDHIQTLAETAGSGLPEGLEDSFEPLRLGPEATCCLLEWEIGSSQVPKRTTFELLDSLCELEMGVDRIGFDHEPIRRFVRARGEAECRAILAEIAARRDRGHWAKALQDTWSGWFKLLQSLSQRWDGKLHLELCAANIGKSWPLAVPVVKQLLKSKDYERRRWFKELGGDRISDDVMQFWHRHVVQFVPDPTRCDYADCARWLAATLELDREGGEALLRQWSTTHALKRNLWKAIAHRGLPVPSGVRSGAPKRAASVPAGARHRPRRTIGRSRV